MTATTSRAQAIIAAGRNAAAMIDEFSLQTNTALASIPAPVIDDAVRIATMTGFVAETAARMSERGTYPAFQVAIRTQAARALNVRFA